jgi:hypothetical protein
MDFDATCGWVLLFVGMFVLVFFARRFQARHSAVPGHFGFYPSALGNGLLTLQV